MISFRRLAVFAPLFLVPLASLYGQRDRITARIDPSRTVVLHGRVRPQATPQNDGGAVEDSFPVQGITLLLKPTAAQQADRAQLLQQQQDPTSPDYHQWLTPEQYADRFGASAGDVAKITAWLESQGFTMANVARSRTYVTVNGTAGQVRSAFGTQIHRYSVNGRPHYANATDPSIPAALADVVGGFHGLSDFHFKPRLKKPAFPEATSSSGFHYIAPDDLATIYNIAPLYAAGVDGSNQTIAVVGQSAIRTSDVQAFRNKFNLGPANLTQVLVPKSSNPGIVSGDVDESHLDIEWAGAVAKNTTIVFVYSTDVWQSALYAVDQDLAKVLSMSYGGCEAYDMVDLPYFQSVVQQANAEGITWLAASGDSGAADCEDPDAVIAQDGLAVDVPAAIPEITGMGGTEFADQGGTYWSSTGAALSYIPEKAWNDTALGSGLAATGGGASTFFPKPSWQNGNGVPNDGARHVPDLSLPASADHDPYYLYSGGVAYAGGTSAGAPSMAGIVALLNQYLVSTNAQKQAGLGNINPALYRLAQSTTGIFHDVTTGNNIVPCVAGSPNCSNGTLGLSAGIGYDPVTGLGSVDAYQLVHQWSGKPATSSAVVPSIDQNPVYQQAPDANGNAWVFQLTLNEEAGVGTTLTDFTIDGVSHAAQIASLFGSATIPPAGSIKATYGFQTLAVPKTVVFGFSGMDAGGQAWTTQLSIPFDGPQVQLAVGGASNAASGQQAYAPGMILSVYGAPMGDFVQSAGTVPLPQFLAGFEAWVNGVTAPLYYVSPNQVNLQIPYETQPGPATLQIGNPYQNATYQFQVVSAAPGIFMFPDGSVNPSRTGARGQAVTLYITGQGQVAPSVATGAAPSARAQTPVPRLPVSVTVGGVQVVKDQNYFIGIPSWSVGVTQINFTIPASAPTGVQPVVVTVGSASSPPANITVQ